MVVFTRSMVVASFLTEFCNSFRLYCLGSCAIRSMWVRMSCSFLHPSHCAAYPSKYLHFLPPDNSSHVNIPFHFSLEIHLLLSIMTYFSIPLILVSFALFRYFFSPLANQFTRNIHQPLLKNQWTASRIFFFY
ncbi:unnamed protein product [Calicophoron daubneyi]|uniref:Uncharacterized protein n=1 Tax=Calicophoron daubneyi TaxID=300641 RepID=A0AAV2TMH4_CALDB